MFFRYYTNMISQASRGLASWIFIAGMSLMGFGVIILAMPKVFAFLAAVVFFIIGIGACVTGFRIFWVQRQLDKTSNEEPDDFRQNVRVHHDKEFFNM